MRMAYGEATNASASHCCFRIPGILLLTAAMSAEWEGANVDVHWQLLAGVGHVQQLLPCPGVYRGRVPQLPLSFSMHLISLPVQFNTPSVTESHFSAAMLQCNFLGLDIQASVCCISQQLQHLSTPLLTKKDSVTNYEGVH